MVGIFILVLIPISHRTNHGRLAYLEEIFDFPSTYLNYMACSLPSVSPPYISGFLPVAHLDGEGEDGIAAESERLTGHWPGLWTPLY